MNNILTVSGKSISPVVSGAMRLCNLSVVDAEKFIGDVFNLGINHFDHADIYGGGSCEEIFGKAFSNLSINRQDVFIQSKCGIVPGKMYDLSKDYIINSVNGCLSRLNLDFLDCLLLHRPDALMEPEEVAAAFDLLYSSGKVRYFGLSNFAPTTISLLKKYLNVPIVFNQIQLGVAHCPSISSGMEFNMMSDGGINRDGGVIDFCRLNDIRIQAWSPFQHGFIEGSIFTNPKYDNLVKCLKDIGNSYGVNESAVAAAWLFRHPCNMQVIAGSMKADRVGDVLKGSSIKLSREEWYKIYLQAGYLLP